MVKYKGRQETYKEAGFVTFCASNRCKLCFNAQFSKHAFDSGHFAIQKALLMLFLRTSRVTPVNDDLFP